MHLTFRSVNQAFRVLVADIHRGRIPTVKSESRNGPVLRIPEPVTITFTNPRERVLFNVGRDINPFFLMYESLWMLAGRRDVEPVAYYAEQMRKYSDDGKVLHGAYGYRWRRHFMYDQLDMAVEELRKNPTSRRVVVAMWDASSIQDNSSDDAADLHGDLEVAMNGGLDVPCNTQMYFDIVDGKLNMTVLNRSNDMIWGLLGANSCHFSFLLEYMACRIGVEVGLQHHFTNNLHIYTESNSGFHPEKWLQGALRETEYADNVEDQSVNGGVLTPPLLLQTYSGFAESFDKEVKEFIDNATSDVHKWNNVFLSGTAEPMCRAFKAHKERNYDAAYSWMERVLAQDWRDAGITWIQRRKQNWKAKNDQANNPYHQSSVAQGDVEPTKD